MAHEHADPGVVIDLNSFGETQSTAVVNEEKFEATEAEERCSLLVTFVFV